MTDGRTANFEKAVFCIPQWLYQSQFGIHCGTAHRVNSYFRMEDCETEEDVAAKVLEWLSREAYKSLHFNSERRNKEVHAYHLQGINAFCGTAFTEDDIDEIYTYLGNRVNHQKTLDFIQSGYDLAVLTRKDNPVK